MLSDVAASGRVSAPDTILVGPRGVGEAAAVSAFSALSREQGFEVISLRLELGEHRLAQYGVAAFTATGPQALVDEERERARSLGPGGGIPQATLLP